MTRELRGQVGLPDWPVMRVEVAPELRGTHRTFRAVRVADRVPGADSGAFRDSAVGTRRSGGPLQKTSPVQGLRTGPGSNVVPGVISASASFDVVAEPRDAV